MLRGRFVVQAREVIGKITGQAVTRGRNSISSVNFTQVKEQSCVNVLNVRCI